MHVIDLKGNEYTLQSTSENEGEVNGNQSFSATILPTKTNLAFIHDISEMWNVIDHDDVEHKIIYCKRRGVGNFEREIKQRTTKETFFLSPNQTGEFEHTTPGRKENKLLTVEIKAIPLFFDDFDNQRVERRIDRHMTAQAFFDFVFNEPDYQGKKSGYGYVLSDKFSSVGWEGLGEGETRLEMFKRGLERYKAEFRIVGNTIYLESRIGRDTQFMYRHRLNASNIEQEIDANEMWTYAKGYGDYEDGEDEGWETAKLVREYTSPLADVIGIRHAPPTKDGRVTSKKSMDESLKQLVDESLKISLSADIHDLRKQGYPVAQSELGDRVFLIDERIGLNEEIRVIAQTIKRDWKGNILDLKVTFGSEGLSKRHQSNINTATKDINEILEGRKQLPYSVLDDAVKNATKALQDAQTELKFTDNGILAIDKNDPNLVTLFNSAGVGVSTDGGGTFEQAITGEGINASVVTTGTLNSDQVAIRGGDGSSYAYISGAFAEFKGKFKRTWRGNTTNHDVRTMLQNGYLRFRNDDKKHSLYFSEFGISTYVDGEGADEEDNTVNGSSGSIVWWDRTHSISEGNPKGITVNSYGGTAALTSDHNHTLMKSKYSARIESTESNIQLNPYSDDTNRSFKFTKSSDRLNGYLLFGDNKETGLRFDGGSAGLIQVIDSDNTTGGSTTLEAGIGKFNILRRRGGNRYVDIVSENYLRIGEDSTKRRIASDAIYKNTYDYGSNVYITTNGTLGRATSASKYKELIEDQFKDEKKQLEHSSNILKLKPKSWYNSEDCSMVSREIESGKKLSTDDFKLTRHVGLTAEDVVDVGLSEHVIYDGEELEAIIYDRMWIHLIPIIKDQRKRIEQLEAQINE